MTLDEYYNNFDTIAALSVDELSALQGELISKLSDKDKYDFYAYLKISPSWHLNKKGKPVRDIKPRITKPKIWKFIYSSLPLFSLFVFADNKHLQKLYKKYKNGDMRVFKKVEGYYD